jgi:uncharacterized cysteine cluster protein YcgN (CxxCxxCC family)
MKNHELLLNKQAENTYLCEGCWDCCVRLDFIDYTK